MLSALYVIGLGLDLSKGEGLRAHDNSCDAHLTLTLILTIVVMLI